MSTASTSAARRPAPPPAPPPHETQLMFNQLAYMQHLQHERALRRVNGVVDKCFDECVTDFMVTRHLSPAEGACLDTCSRKYLLFQAHVGDAFTQALAGGGGAPS